MSNKISASLFQAAAIIYQQLLGASTNRMPHHPEHAHRAKALANGLYEQSRRDPTLTLCAARILCGFLKNDTSAHCSDVELIGWGVAGAQSLIEVFRTAPAPQTMVNNMAPANPYPTMPPIQPQVAAPPVPQPTPFQPPPPVALEIPDFGEGQ